MRTACSWAPSASAAQRLRTTTRWHRRASRSWVSAIFPRTLGVRERLAVDVTIQLFDPVGHVTDEAHAVGRALAGYDPYRQVGLRQILVSHRMLGVIALEALLANLRGDNVSRRLALRVIGRRGAGRVEDK